MTLIRTYPQALEQVTTITVTLNNQRPDQLTLSTTVVTFRPQDTTRSITVTAIDDERLETTQSYQINIQIPDDVPAIASNHLRVTVPSNDPLSYILSFDPTNLVLKAGQSAEVEISLASNDEGRLISFSLVNPELGTIELSPSTITLSQSERQALLTVTVKEDGLLRRQEQIIRIEDLTGIKGLANPERLDINPPLTITIPTDGTRIRVRVFLEGALP